MELIEKNHYDSYVGSEFEFDNLIFNKIKIYTPPMWKIVIILSMFQYVTQIVEYPQFNARFYFEIEDN
jgi:hypothetical protein